MQKLDGILKGHHMDVLGLVEFIEHGSERGGLAVAGCTRHKNNPVFLPDDLAKHRPQPEPLQGRNLRRQFSEHDPVRAVLAEHIHAEPGGVVERVTGVTGTLLLEILVQAGVLTHEMRTELGRLGGSEQFQPGNRYRPEAAATLDLRRASHNEKKVGDVFGALQQPAKQRVHVYGKTHPHF